MCIFFLPTEQLLVVRKFYLRLQSRSGLVGCGAGRHGAVYDRVLLRLHRRELLFGQLLDDKSGRLVSLALTWDTSFQF